MSVDHAVAQRVTHTRTPDETSNITRQGKRIVQLYRSTMLRKNICATLYEAEMLKCPYDPNPDWPITDEEYECFIQYEQSAGEGSGYFAASQALFAAEGDLITWLERFLRCHPGPSTPNYMQVIRGTRTQPGHRQHLVEIALHTVEELP